MTSNLLTLPPIPTAQQRVVDPKTGFIDQAWYQYLRALDAHMRDAERRLTAGSL